jgi:hypothetical protein
VLFQYPSLHSGNLFGNKKPHPALAGWGVFMAKCRLLAISRGWAAYEDVVDQEDSITDVDSAVAVGIA